VQDNLRNPALDVPFILRCLGVSRSRLYRLFEASGGIMHYIQKRRLVAAHKVLADPLNGRRIFEVADEFCFNDAAEFSRAFRREFGYAPSDLRAGNCGASSLHRPSLRLANELADLLKRI
jgi:AraC-like DNA-binding protein